VGVLNKNTAMIVSLTKIYCTSDLKKKRTLTVYQNVTQYNNQQKHSHDSEYILVSDTIMAVFLLIIVLCDVLIDRECSFLLKIRCTIYFSE
jgi:hypothetical protein